MQTASKLLSVRGVGDEPESLPVSVDDLKKHCRVEFSDEDSYLTILLSGACDYAGQLVNRALVVRDYEAVFTCFPGQALPSWSNANPFPGNPASDGILYIPRPPLVEVDGIDYQKTDGSTGTLSAEDLVVDAASQWARIRPASGAWPTDADLSAVRPVVVRFSAGYTSLPPSLKMGILLLAAHWYEHREAAAPVVMTEMPMAFRAIMDNWTMPEAV